MESKHERRKYFVQRSKMKTRPWKDLAPHIKVKQQALYNSALACPDLVKLIPTPYFNGAGNYIMDLISSCCKDPAAANNSSLMALMLRLYNRAANEMKTSYIKQMSHSLIASIKWKNNDAKDENTALPNMPGLKVKDYAEQLLYHPEALSVKSGRGGKARNIPVATDKATMIKKLKEKGFATRTADQIRSTYRVHEKTTDQMLIIGLQVTGAAKRKVNGVDGYYDFNLFVL